jgi:hypothetical protein
VEGAALQQLKGGVQMPMKKVLEVEVEMNDAGVGYVPRLPARAFLRCQVFTEDREVPLVEIQGDAAGLTWLATKILAVANSSPGGYHAHVEADDGLEGNCGLIFARR